MKKTMLAGIGALALGLLALAQTGKGKVETQNPSYQGSIPVQEMGMGEKDEAQALQAMARITPEQAVRAAQQYLNTSASPAKVALGNENGYLVWEVVIGGQEVKVDAGTGQVLHKEVYGQEEDHEDRGNQEDHGQDGEESGE